MGFSNSEDGGTDDGPQHLSKEATGEHENGEEADASSEEDELYNEPRTFEREDVEIGVDQLISRMIKAKLISKEKVGRQPTLWKVFTTFYGESDPILELVDSFEQHIKGYFDVIENDEMQAAFDDIEKIKALIEQDLRTTSA